MTRLKFNELEELVRSDPEVDADEAMEYGDWLAFHRPGRRERPPRRRLKEFLKRRRER
ncbi:hypothetical protein [Actinomadura sp. HBU206391]|uniref:hypothetical protein n=1 Tax=Actinomadura sp. HBU206391 TaxID=2731692 RepID=UPI00164FC759|nr:hypothetical protein [Actinomadura sp. HBU206391]MBC6456961.1 hypothetical protein [Actinomadura sp. HBU206391]